MKSTKSKLPIGIIPFSARVELAKRLVYLAISTLLGNEWTNNIATDKEVRVCYTLIKPKTKLKVPPSKGDRGER